MGTYGSRSLAVGGSAIVKATEKIIAKAKKIAAHLMEASDQDVVFKDGKFTVAGTDKSVAWTDVTLAAYVPHKYPIEELEPGLEETSFYDPANFTYPAGAYACEVEVDPETGEVEVLAFTAADDFGNIVNPMIVEGQVHGGLAQGIGQALLEAAAYDETGQLTDRLAHGLRHAARRRPAELRGRPFLRHPLHPQPARGEGLRRGRRHRLAAGAGQRRARRAQHRRVRRSPTSTCRSRPPGSGRRWTAAQLRRRAMYAFEFVRPTTVEEAVAALAAEEAQALGGGQTLIPTLKQRLASPGDAGQPHRHRQPQGRRHARRRARDRRRHHPRHRRARGRARPTRRSRRWRSHIGDPAVQEPRHDRRQPRQQRSLGRLSGGGARPPARPSSPTPARSRPTTIFQGMFTTALEPGEIITEVRFPIPERANYQKFLQPASRFALVGVFVAKFAGGVRVAVTGASEDGVFRWTEAEAALGGDFRPEAVKGLKASADGMIGDLHGTPEYRAHLIGVLTARAVAAA